MKSFGILEKIFIIILSFLFLYNIALFANEINANITEYEIENEDGTISKFRYEDYEDKLIIYSFNPSYLGYKTIHDKINNTKTLYELQENELGEKHYIEISFTDNSEASEIYEQMEIERYSSRKYSILSRKLNQNFNKDRLKKSLQIY